MSYARDVTVIAIAVVEHAGRFLVGCRPSGVPLAGMAEFPGGKVMPGETPERAAVRECLEETRLAVRVVELYQTVEHDYPHGRVVLHFFRCLPVEPATAEQVLAEPFHWVAAAELRQLEFPAANRELVARLSDEILGTTKDTKDTKV